MKVLWFTNTPSKAGPEFGYDGFSGGWISALETLVVAEQMHELGICFFYNGSDYKRLVKDKVTYYGIPFDQDNFFSRIINRQNGNLNDTKSPFIDSILSDFKPDVIHVFGTEHSYGKMLINKFDKVVFHIQGLIAPYAEVFFPGNFTKKTVLRKSSLGDIFRGVTFYHRYLVIKKRGLRETEIIKQWKYFTGRTDWDRNYVKLINPGSTYFHCEELLRAEFFLNQWQPLSKPAKGQTIVIGTTINPNIYKGLDLVYKVVALLKDYNICWKIFGIAADNPVNTIVKKVLGIKENNPAIKFYKQLGPPQLIEELKTCHFFVHPSYIDNSPNSVCEAMLLGMPVLSSSVGGVNSLITHKENGFLFNPYDQYELAGLLAHLVNNYDAALAVTQNARATAQRRHSPEDILTVINKMYNSINDK